MTKEEIIHLLETEYLNGDIDIAEVKKRIGVPTYISSDNTFKKLGIFDEFKKIQNKRRGLSTKKTNLARYGVANGHDEKAKEKLKQTSLAKYGTENPWQAKEVKQKCYETRFKKYGDKHYTNREKAFETTKKNGMYRTKLEDRYLDRLKKVYPDIIQHYTSEKYPFECDFYIPSKDLYIELNVFYLHGGHFFDENNPEDINKLNDWKSRDIDTTVWTVKDLIKRDFAIRNKLNYLVLWSEEELIDFIENDNYTLVDTNIKVSDLQLDHNNRNQCQICGMFHENISGHVRNFHKMSSKNYYDKYLKQPGEGICPTCGKPTSYINFTIGYRKHCSTKCSSLDPKVQEKVKTTNLEKYGVENPYQAEEVKKIIKVKAKQTKLSKPKNPINKNISKEKQQFEIDNDCIERSKLIEKYGYGWYQAKIVQPIYKYIKGIRVSFYRNCDIYKIENYYKET